jgi:hypothetical protein
MELLFSLLDGVAALWLSLFSPRRYLRIAAAIELKRRGARAFGESYVTTNLVPVIISGSLAAALQALLPEGGVANFLAGKELASFYLCCSAILAYYSLRRSREFGQNSRKFRHALKLITSNARTVTTAQIGVSGTQLILLWSFMSLKAQALGEGKSVGTLQAFLTASPASMLSVVFLVLLYLLMVILQFVIGIRVLVFFARTFRIRFWRSVWLQIRYPMLFGTLFGALALGVFLLAAWAALSPLDNLVVALAALIALLIILAVVPSGRTWMARAVVPRRQPSTIVLRQAAAGRSGKIRIVEGPLAGTVVPVASPLVIGRDPARAQIVFPAGDTLVSRRHCEVRFNRAAALFEVRDLGSRNGTYVANGPGRARRLKPDVVERVTPGHRLWVGSSRDQVLLELN